MRASTSRAICLPSSAFRKFRLCRTWPGSPRTAFALPCYGLLPPACSGRARSGRRRGRGVERPIIRDHPVETEALQDRVSPRFVRAVAQAPGSRSNSGGRPPWIRRWPWNQPARHCRPRPSSGLPPTRVATTGIAHAMASRSQCSKFPPPAKGARSNRAHAGFPARHSRVPGSQARSKHVRPQPGPSRREP